MTSSVPEHQAHPGACRRSIRQHSKVCRSPSPPLAEQRRIVAKVDQLMALVDELETHLAASRATAKNLLQALVAELTDGGARFSGESLVPKKVLKTSPKASAVQ